MATDDDRDLSASPFLCLDDPFSWLELMRMVVAFPLAVVRLIGVVVAALAGVLATIVTDRPAACVRGASTAILRCFGYADVEVRGVAHVASLVDSDRGGVAVFNHVSFLDGLLMISRLHVFGFLARRATLPAPLRGGLERIGGIVCAPGESVSGLVRQRCASVAPFPLAVAPEGVTTNGRALARFRTGAFLAGVPVLPILLRYPYSPREGGGVNAAWTQRSPAWTAWRLLCRAVWSTNRASVEVLPLMTPAPDETASAFAERVRRAMARALGVPCVDKERAAALRDQLEIRGRRGGGRDRYINFAGC